MFLPTKYVVCLPMGFELCHIPVGAAVCMDGNHELRGISHGFISVILLFTDITDKYNITSTLWANVEVRVDRAKLGYVEDFGLLFEGVGGSRMVGRVLGLLLVSETPELPAEEIAVSLHASQGAISTATRTLVGIGLVRRRTRPGERRSYFGVNPDAWQETTRQQIAGSGAFREMAERGLELAGQDGPEVRRGLEAMRDFYAFWERELSDVLARWEGEKRRKDREVG
jgi:hypothetical protein